MSKSQYTAKSIEVLTGLEPVRKRPGMYTDTSRPNHLVAEVVDNSVDEVLAGYGSCVAVHLRKDGFIEVSDDGRGMPTDIHPEEGVPGVELIMTRLHAGGKFNHDNYQYSGGLHGVGVSVVNALSAELTVHVKRDGQQYQMSFRHGEKTSDLEVVGEVGKRTTGTRLCFRPHPEYFDTVKIADGRLRHLLRAKAVLCPGLKVTLLDETDDTPQQYEWQYEAGLSEYMTDQTSGFEVLPAAPFTHSASAEHEAVDWAVQWLPEGGEVITESYVNLVPTVGHGTHVNGLRSGLVEAIREFCELRDLLPRGLKLSADDIWDKCCFVLSAKIREPQFSGQTKERLTSRQCSAFISGIAKDSFSLWLNQHTDDAEKLAEFAINNAQARLKASKQVARKKVTSGPALPGKLTDCSSTDASRSEIFLVEGDSAGGSAKQARDREFQAVLPLRGKILNTWEIDAGQILASQEVHDIAVALGVDPGNRDLSGLRYGKVCILADADSDGLHIATLLCALFMRHFPALIENGHIFVAMPPLFRIDVGKDVYYALSEAERQGVLDRIAAEKKTGRITVQRFKGLGEMNALQLRETTMAVETRNLVQLTLDEGPVTTELLDKLLGKKRAPDRRAWLEEKGALAELI